MGRTKLEYEQSEKFYNYLIKLLYEDEKLYKYIYDIKVLNEELNLKQIKTYLEYKIILLNFKINDIHIPEIQMNYRYELDITKQMIQKIDNILNK